MENLTSTRAQLTRELNALQLEIQKIKLRMMPKSTSLNQTNHKLDKVAKEIETNKALVNQYQQEMRRYSHKAQESVNISVEYQNQYEKYWKHKEKQWFEWNTKTLVNWFFHIIKHNDCNYVNNINIAINYNNIENLIDNCFIKSRFLAGLNKDDLKRIGFNDDNVIDYLLTKIEKLCKDNPQPSKSNLSGKRNLNNIMIDDLEDNDNVCAISGRKMEVPVIGGDTQVYERKNIENYLRTNGKYPNGSAVIDVEGEICQRLVPMVVLPPKKRQRT